MAWRLFPRCRSRPPTFITAAARRIAGTSRPPSISAAIRSFWTTSISRPAAIFPTPTHNVKFAHKLDFYREMAQWFADRKPGPRVPQGLAPHRRRRSQRGAARARRLEPQATAEIVSHTPVEVDLFGRLQASLDWIDVPRRFVSSDEKLYSWWSYRNNDWRASNRGRRLDDILATPGAVGRHHEPSYRRRPARLEQGFGSRAGARNV